MSRDGRLADFCLNHASEYETLDISSFVYQTKGRFIIQ